MRLPLQGNSCAPPLVNPRAPLPRIAGYNTVCNYNTAGIASPPITNIAGQALTFFQDEPLFECNCFAPSTQIEFYVPAAGNYALTYCAACRSAAVAEHLQALRLQNGRTAAAQRCSCSCRWLHRAAPPLQPCTRRHDMYASAHERGRLCERHRPARHAGQGVTCVADMSVRPPTSSATHTHVRLSAQRKRKQVRLSCGMQTDSAAGRQ